MIHVETLCSESLRYANSMSAFGSTSVATQSYHRSPKFKYHRHCQCINVTKYLTSPD
uniref:Uncharacterized protein n=1 Tax=Arundo donax TaxID=35708 RepID=A0A0A8YWK3_ARUDO